AGRRSVDRVLAARADRRGAGGGHAGRVPAAALLARGVAAARRVRRAAGDGGGRVDAARSAPPDDLERRRDGGDPLNTRMLPDSGGPRSGAERRLNIRVLPDENLMAGNGSTGGERPGAHGRSRPPTPRS